MLGRALLRGAGLGSLGALGPIGASVLWPPVLEMEEAEPEFSASLGGQMALL